MANKHQGEVPIEVDGHKYTLVLTTNSLVELEERVNMSMGELSDTMTDPKKFRVKMLRDIFWASLIAKHPAITDDEVKRILDGLAPGEAMALATKVFQMAFPEAQEGDGAAKEDVARPPQVRPDGGTG